MKQFKRNPNQGGFTLIELLLVLAIIAALAVAAFVIFPRVQAGRAATSNAQLLSAAQANLKAIYTSGNYSSLDTEVAIQAGLFPDTMATDATTLINEWEGDIDVYGSDKAGVVATTGARYFTVVFPEVPEDVCKRLVPATAGNFGRISIGTEVVYDQYDATQIDMDEAAVLDACADGGVTITWTAN